MIVALYARVSTEGQTIENQLNKLFEFSTARGYIVYDKYADVVSGKNKNRPELDRMTADAKARKFDRILAVKIDRLGRSVIHLNEFFADMESYGVGIEMTDQPIDTTSSMGKFTRNILSAVAELERELISERTKDGLKRAVADGAQLGRIEKKLSAYQIEKAKMILAENPKISQRALAEQFEGISRNTFLKLARAEGLIQ